MADREAIHPVACGYGLLGLCCDSCLCGPCRQSPFDDTPGGARCGADGDWIVANNLMERVLLESLQAMAAFRNALERAPGPGDRVDAARREEMKLLLSPFSREGNRLLEAFYPEQAFPSLHALGFPKGSWMAEILDATAGRPPARREPEAIVADALRLSAIALAADDLSRELDGPAPEEALTALPDSPSPLLFIVADEKDNPDALQESLLKAIEAVCGKEARIYRLPNVAPLPAFARAVFAKWGTPLSMTASTALVASSSIAQGLGALALGCSLVAIPGYPIGGSVRVEAYLTEQMRNTFGHAYLPVPPREDPCDAIHRSLAS
jgi:hypothetical protein